MPPTSPTHVEFIARGLIVHRGHALVCWSRRGDYGYLPGGHIEIDESAFAALAREMMEETGLKCRVGPLLLVHENRFATRKKAHHEVNLVFAAEISDRAFLKADDKVCHVAQSNESSILKYKRGRTGKIDAISPPLVASREGHLEFRWLAAAAFQKAKIYPAPMAEWAARVMNEGLDSTVGMVATGVPAAEWLSTMDE